MATTKKAAAKKAPKKKAASKKTADPCWDGYEKIGTKKKGQKTVPNCVPEKKKQQQGNQKNKLFI